MEPRENAPRPGADADGDARSRRGAQNCDFRLRIRRHRIEGATNGPRADESARLAWLDHEMRRRLSRSGRVDVVDVANVADRTRARDLRTCGGCDAGFAGELGARYSVTGWVQKVSNLILNMNVVVRDAGTGEVVLSKSVDMRGNTDESWSRALDWLVNRYLLAPDTGVF